MAVNGALSGPVTSITVSCLVLEPWAAVIIGLIVGFIYIAVSKLLLSVVKLKIDGTVDAVPVNFF